MVRLPLPFTIIESSIATGLPFPFSELDFVGTIGSTAADFPFPFPFNEVEPPFNIAVLLAGPSAANELPSCLRRPADMPEQPDNCEWSRDRQPKRIAAAAAWVKNAALDEVVLEWPRLVPVDLTHRIRSLALLGGALVKERLRHSL